MNTVISYPIPAYQNYPIQPQFYQPSRFVISAVTLGTVTTVTTSVANNYVIGQQVRLNIPEGYGCTQLNQETAYVIAILSPTQVVLDISSLGFDQFVNAMSPNSPQIVAIGDINFGHINASGRMNQGTFILGSFINISPE